MKKGKLFFYYFIVLCFIASCDNQAKITENGKVSEASSGEASSGKRVLNSELKRSGGLWYYNGTSFTGIGFDMFNKEQFERELTYKDGVLDGPFKTYELDGSVHLSGYFKNGKQIVTGGKGR